MDFSLIALKTMRSENLLVVTHSKNFFGISDFKELAMILQESKWKKLFSCWNKWLIYFSNSLKLLYIEHFKLNASHAVATFMQTLFYEVWKKHNKLKVISLPINLINIIGLLTNFAAA